MTRKIKNTFILFFSLLLVCMAALFVGNVRFSTKPASADGIGYNVDFGGLNESCATVTQNGDDLLSGQLGLGVYYTVQLQEGKDFTGYWANEYISYAFDINTTTYKELFEMANIDHDTKVLYVSPVLIDSSKEITITFDCYFDDDVSKSSNISIIGKWKDCLKDLKSQIERSGYTYTIAQTIETIDDTIEISEFEEKNLFEITEVGSDKRSDYVIHYQSIPTQTVNVMYDNQVIKSYTVEQGSIITADTLRKDLARDGYELVGLSYTADGAAAQLADLTVTSDMTLYAVYDEVDDEESNFGDKISDFANNVSDWLKDNTGVAVSSGSLIVAAIVIVLIMLTKRK